MIPAILGGKPVLCSPEKVAEKHRLWPVIEKDDKDAVMAVLDRGILAGPFAPEVQALQNEFASYIGTKYALATNSGTAALHIGLAALGVGPGDEVIVPAFTFVASALAAVHQNAIPVFVDIELDTLGMDPKKVEEAITPRTRAIMPVHIHGTPCKIDEILEIAKRHSIPVIEDACQAHGATFKGKKVGSFGDCAAFSLQASKNLACGEGGLFVTNNEKLVDGANQTRMFGEAVNREDVKFFQPKRPLDSNRAYDSLTVGWMYRMNELSAALTRTQLRKLDSWNEKGRRNAAYLSKRLATLPGVKPPNVPKGAESCFHKYRVQLDGTAAGVDVPAKILRDRVTAALRAEGVEAVLWQSQAVPGQGLFKNKTGYAGKGWPWKVSEPVNYDLANFPVTNALLERSICLFSHSFPITAQSEETVKAYGDAFEKVWTNLKDIVRT